MEQGLPGLGFIPHVPDVVGILKLISRVVVTRRIDVLANGEASAGGRLFGKLGIPVVIVALEEPELTQESIIDTAVNSFRIETRVERRVKGAQCPLDAEPRVGFLQRRIRCHGHDVRRARHRTTQIAEHVRIE